MQVIVDYFQLSQMKSCRKGPQRIRNYFLQQRTYSFNKVQNSFKFMRRRSLRLLRPNPILNSDGDTGEFFRVKNYQREFFARKPVGLNSQVLPSELTL